MGRGHSGFGAENVRVRLEDEDRSWKFSLLTAGTEGVRFSRNRIKKLHSDSVLFTIIMRHRITKAQLQKMYINYIKSEEEMYRISVLGGINFKERGIEVICRILKEICEL